MNPFKLIHYRSLLSEFIGIDANVAHKVNLDLNILKGIS